MEAAITGATKLIQSKRVEILVPPQAAAWLQVIAHVNIYIFSKLMDQAAFKLSDGSCLTYLVSQVSSLNKEETSPCQGIYT